jgi:hypothetical protein
MISKMLFKLCLGGIVSNWRYANGCDTETVVILTSTFIPSTGRAEKKEMK